MNSNTYDYARFKEKQTKLAKMIKEGSEYIILLNMNQYSDSLKDLSNKTNLETFKIQVIGTSNNGKSNNIKLSQSAGELKRIINNEALVKIIPQQLAMLTSSLEDIKARYQEAQYRLHDMEYKKREMAARISDKIHRMDSDFNRCIDYYFYELTNKIHVWIEECKPSAFMNIINIRKCVEIFVNEIRDSIKGSIEEDQTFWQNNIIEPLITDRIEDLMQTVEQNLEIFYIEVDQIRLDIAGKSSPANSNAVPLWQRGTANDGGLQFFAKGVGQQVSAYLRLTLFGLLNSVTIRNFIMGGMILPNFLQMNQIVLRVKHEFKRNIIEQVNSMTLDIKTKCVNNIISNITDRGNEIVKSMDIEIKEIRIQVEDIIKQIDTGKEQAEQRRNELIICTEKLKKLNVAVDDFIFEYNN